MNKIIWFLKKNGFKKTDTGIYSNDFVSATVTADEIIISDNFGMATFLNMELYSLIGYLIHNRIIGFNYKY